MKALIFLPVIFPLATAILLVALRGRQGWQNKIGLLSHGLQFLIAGRLLIRVAQEGIQAASVGNWPAPFGIALVADLFSGLILVAATLVAFCCSLSSWRSEEITAREKKSGCAALTQLLMTGVALALLTGDLFNLFVSFEIMLMASFVLMTLSGSRERLRASVEYVAINVVASTFFLAAMGLLYAKAGTLNMADLSWKLASATNIQPLLPIALLVSLAFGIKAALFPLYFWLPDSYPTLPTPLLATFGGILTKVGVYALIRLWSVVFAPLFPETQWVWMTLASLTMFLGVVGAMAQYGLKRLLSFHIISQVGYMVLALAIFSPRALAAGIFFLLHNMIAKTNLFLIGGAVRKLGGSDDLREVGGLWQRSPALTACFAISALGLAGFPPLSGFFAKYFLLDEALRQGAWWGAATALLVSLLTLFSMLKIWQEVFWKPAPTNPPRAELFASELLPIFLLAAGVVGLGLAAGPLFSLCEIAGQQLRNPEAYIRAVLGGSHAAL